MDVQEIRDGLWRWTAPHPDWKPDADWPEQVGCVYYEGPEDVVLIDPLVPGADEDRFWRALDRDVERLARPVRVLQTVRWHERSCARIAERYGGSVWYRGPRSALPAGVEAIDVEPAEETVFWVHEHRALVPGDVLLAEDGSLEVCPLSWLPEGTTVERFSAALAPLRALPVELVLVSHGAPILDTGSDALARALDHAPRA
jgi:glyoxylase-like metal-dependent hydrolase (beta-lactamase superfamily II)